MIMEISSNKEKKFGISGSGGTVFDIAGESVPLMLGFGGLGVSGLDMSQLMKGGFATGLQGPLVDVSTGSSGDTSGVSGDLSIPQYGFMLQAIASNSDVNILSTPHILTTDNEEAEIQVGKQIPYSAASSGLGGLGGLASMAGLAGLGGANRATSALSSYGGYGGYGGLSSMLGGYGMGMVQRIDVDLTLKITPHVNESNYVRLEIDQSIEDVESIDRELGPTTSKRKVKNTVVVRDQQPVVIGGLIRDTESEGVDKVPFLGDIPLIGILFRKTVKKTEKKNLLMIIIPHIIEDPSDLARIHKERMDEMKRFAEYLATKERERKGIVDYQKKNGALEHMRQVVDGAKTEREAREKAEFEGTAVDLVGPPETHDLEYDPTLPPAEEETGKGIPLPPEGAAPPEGERPEEPPQP
jgi:general secretion pathway protein D